MPLSTLVLLGAGASVDAGIPATKDMTRRIVQLVSESTQGTTPEIAPALNYVLATMNAAQTAYGASAFDVIDVERLFSAVEQLADRSELEISPFVASWHETVEALDRVSPKANLASSVSEALLGRTASHQRLAEALSGFIRAEVGTGTGKIYRGVLNQMTLALRKVVHVTSAESVDYLSPIVNQGRLGTVTIATLNYDRTVELAASARGIECGTGIAEWSKSGKWKWPARGIKLLKLHGSIDWSWSGASDRSLRLPAQTLFASPNPLTDRTQPAVVFGHRGKLTAQGPFLELLGQFAQALDAATRLVIVGYSFRDEHINEYVRRWANGDDARSIVVVDPLFPDIGPNRYSRLAREKSFRADLVLGLVPPERPTEQQPYFDARLQVVYERAREGLAVVFPHQT
jgi:hypothetical protein